MCDKCALNTIVHYCFIEHKDIIYDILDIVLVRICLTTKVIGTTILVMHFHWHEDKTICVDDN